MPWSLVCTLCLYSSFGDVERWDERVRSVSVTSTDMHTLAFRNLARAAPTSGHWALPFGPRGGGGGGTNLDRPGHSEHSPAKPARMWPWSYIHCGTLLCGCGTRMVFGFLRLDASLLSHHSEPESLAESQVIADKGTKIPSGGFGPPSSWIRQCSILPCPDAELVVVLCLLLDSC